MRRLLLLPLLALLLVLAPPSHACGVFVAQRAFTVPFLDQERVLLLWDSTTRTEHFVREIHFERVASRFGFVVPVPAKPEVAKVDKSPFDALHERWAWRDPTPRKPGLAGGAARGGGVSTAAPAVKVLSEQRIGSFTAFVLAASDAGALDKWLRDNELEPNPDSASWLAHYVALGFFYVAMRYEPSSASSGDTAMASETVRITFSTPNPYYPYREPSDPKKLQMWRSLAVWMVTREPMAPVAARAAMDATTPATWTRPWNPGAPYVAPKKALAAALPELASLLPDSKALVVAPYYDGAVHRYGVGDVIAVPREALACDEACVKLRRALVRVIDPSLHREAIDALALAPLAGPKPLELTATPDPWAVDKKRMCSAAPPSAFGRDAFALAAFGFASVVAAVRARRRARRWLALPVGVVLVAASTAACKKAPSGMLAFDDPTMPAATMLARSAPAADRARLALELLSGHRAASKIAAASEWHPFAGAKVPEDE